LHAPRHHLRAIRSGVRQEEQERALVEPPEDVRVARCDQEDAGELLQHELRGLALEAEHHARERRSEAHRALELLVELVREVGVVEELRLGVDHGRAQRVFLRAAAQERLGEQGLARLDRARRARELGPRTAGCREHAPQLRCGQRSLEHAGRATEVGDRLGQRVVLLDQDERAAARSPRQGACDLVDVRSLEQVVEQDHVARRGQARLELLRRARVREFEARQGAHRRANRGEQRFVGADQMDGAQSVSHGSSVRGGGLAAWFRTRRARAALVSAPSVGNAPAGVKARAIP
jgi:hypothetical protein